MRINFILVNYNGAADTANCILSIINNKFDANISLRILVVDNDSPKEGLDKIFELLSGNIELKQILDNIYRIDVSSEIVFIQTKRNGGFGFANNKGIKYIKQHQFTSDDLVVLLNNDTEVNPLFINKIVNFNSQNRITSRLLAFSVKSLNYYTHDIDSEGFAYINRFTGRSSHTSKYKYSYLVGSCIIMNCIDQIPLFDENYFLYYEDADYSNLLRMASYTLSYDENNYFYHKVNASTKSNPKIEAIKKESMIRFMRKNISILFNICFIIIRVSVYLFTCRLFNIRSLLHGYSKSL